MAMRLGHVWHQGISIREKCSLITALITGVLIGLRHSLFFTVPLPLISLFSLGIFLAKPGRRPTICFAVIGILAATGLSLALHPTPFFSLRMQRYIALIIGMLSLSPLFQDESYTRWRMIVLEVIYLTLYIMVALSFMLWLYYIAPWGDTVSKKIFHNYGYTGLFSTGLIMSLAAAIVALISLARLLEKRGPHPVMSYLPIFTVSFILCIAGGSRITVAGFGVSLVMLLIFKRKQVAQLFRLRLSRWVTGVVLILIAVSIPKAYHSLKLKSDYAQSYGTIFYSRHDLWNARIAEWESSPLTGIGYANEFPSSRNNNGDLTVMEPGSSWLSVLSYSGLLGGAAFVWLFIWFGHKIVVNPLSRTGTQLSLFLLFILNGLSEGWLLFAGSFIFPVFWLVVSLTSFKDESVKIGIGK